MGVSHVRMKMYIDVYGLSLLRFWVTAFIC